MASISGTTKTTNGIKGYGGLASGLDTDSLIEGMTANTRARIAKQLQNKQTYQWKMDAYRSISDKLIKFSKKYTDFSSSSNLQSNKMFSAALTKMIGENSKYVTVSGTSTKADSVSLVGVSQMASDTKLTSNSAVSTNEFKGFDMALEDRDISVLEGKSISIKYGSETYSVRLKSGEGFKYGTMDEVAASINASLKDVPIKGIPGKTLGDKITVLSEGANNRFAFASSDPAAETNNITLLKDDAGVLGLLGFEVEEGKDGVVIKDDTVNVARGTKNAEILHRQTFAQRVAGKSLTFSYNGVSKTIAMPKAEDFRDANGNEITDEAALTSIMTNTLQKNLDNAYGKGRIKVGNDGKALTMKTMLPSGGEDNSSVIRVTGGSTGLLGSQGTLGLMMGEANRVNMQASFANAGLINSANGTNGYTYKENDAEGNEQEYLNLWINGKQIKGLKTDSTMNQIVEKINASDAGVTVQYLENRDKFVVNSTESGMGGEISFDSDKGGNFANLMFGTQKDNPAGDNTDTNTFKIDKGSDALIQVKYAGSDDIVTLQRNSNSFNLEGLNISVKSTFNVDGSEVPITFESVKDVDKLANTVKDMIKDYNDIIESVNGQMTTKKNRDYAPLTEEQREGMTDDQIKTWEAKAKSGMLYNDSDLRGLSDSLRFVFSGSASIKELESFGMTLSTNPLENGKITFDEEKFKAAMDTNPERIQEIFTKSPSGQDKGGITYRLKEATEKYASTTYSKRGILLQKAGSPHAATSELDNSLLKAMNEIDETVKGLKKRLLSEQSRYQQQFTRLEQVISQMNSQSSYLGQMTGA